MNEYIFWAETLKSISIYLFMPYLILFGLVIVRNLELNKVNKALTVLGIFILITAGWIIIISRLFYLGGQPLILPC